MRRNRPACLALAATLALVACQNTTDVADLSLDVETLKVRIDGRGSVLDCLRDRLGVLGTIDDLLYVTGDVADDRY
jgi:hypothetical protein